MGMGERARFDCVFFQDIWRSVIIQLGNKNTYTDSAPDDAQLARKWRSMECDAPRDTTDPQLFGNIYIQLANLRFGM